MKITNKTGLPEPIVRAIENDPYSRGDADISVTELVGPPQIRYLKRKHWEELEEDASDRIWALLGQSVHHIIERAAGGDDLPETRLYMYAGAGLRLSGQFDNYSFATYTLTDYKVTSVYAVKGDLKPEWERQCNVNAALIRAAGGDVRRMEIVAILRDWSVRKARMESGYPNEQVIRINVPLWDHDHTLKYIEARAQLHRSRPDMRCTDEERWETPTTYAVKMNGNKKALRVLPTAEEAEAWRLQFLESKAATDKPGTKREVWIETRPGENKRCADYCPVRDFCEQYAAIRKDREVA